MFSTDFEDKIKKLEQDLAERTKKCIEETIALQAIISEKEKIIEHLQESVEEHSKMKDAIHAAVDVPTFLQELSNLQGRD